MTISAKKRLLLADADLMSAATTISALKDGYHIITVNSAADLFKQLKKNEVDMVLLETGLPDKDGFEVCQQIKADPQTANLPVVFLTSKNTVTAEEKGFSVGAVEYIVKPISVPTVKARIRNQLKLSSAIKELQRLNTLALDANPNTGLPGNTSILNELQRLVAEGESVAVIYADLDNFKAYNDRYGFAQGDAVITFTANVIRVALQAHGCADAFLGHIGGDDFVLTLPAEKQAEVCAEIIRRVDSGIAEFYSAEDVARGYIVAEDREGKERHYPLISLSMGGADLSRRKLTSAFEIVDICTETKKLAKLRAGSNIVIDQRRSG